MLEAKIQLEVLGLTVSQLSLGGYVLLLGEIGSKRRVPVVIGMVEAQSIAMQMQGMEVPRPLTHDLVYSVLCEYDISLREIQIYRLEKDIFYSRIVCRRGAEDGKCIDARTSDAIALAIKSGCPIYMDADLFARVSIICEERELDGKRVVTPPNPLSCDSIDELEAKLKEAVRMEKYELAAQIRDEINKRNGK